jgi:hypothetical protein
MPLLRQPYLPSPELMDEIRRPVERLRVVAAMLGVGLVGPLAGLALSGDWRDRGLAGFLAYDAAIAVVAAALALRQPSRREVGWFVTLHRVPLTRRNGPTIVDYLARTRRWRAYGVVGSLGVGQGVMFSSPGTQLNGYVLLFAGWFVGGILAEVPVGRRRVGGVQVASLQPRTLSMYLSPGVAGWLVGWAVGTVGLLVVYGATESPLGTGRVVAALAGLAALTLLSVWSMLVIVRRPQPAAPPDIVAADDATRRAAIRRVAAGWGVVQCMVSVAVGQWLSIGAESNLVANLGVAAVYLGAVGVLATWLVVPTRLSPPQTATDRLAVP